MKPNRCLKGLPLTYLYPKNFEGLVKALRSLPCSSRSTISSNSSVWQPLSPLISIMVANHFGQVGPRNHQQRILHPIPFHPIHPPNSLPVPLQRSFSQTPATKRKKPPSAAGSHRTGPFPTQKERLFPPPLFSDSKEIL